jgi:hypothetical protein
MRLSTLLTGLHFMIFRAGILSLMSKARSTVIFGLAVPTGISLLLWGENSVTYFQAAISSFSLNLDSIFFRSSRVNFHSKGLAAFSDTV